MLQDYATQMPRFGFIPRPGGLEDDEGARGERMAQAALARQQERRALFALLGAPLYARTTTLPLVGGGYLGPAHDRWGGVLKWGLWSPHRRALIDVFSKTLPSTAELEDRSAFAQAHGIRYALVRPGARLTTESLGAWLNQGEGARL